MDAANSRRGWLIHGAALLGFAVAYACIFWRTWAGPASLDRLGALFVGLALVVHALVSTLVVALAKRRRVAVAVVLHLVVLSAFVVGRLIELADAEQRARAAAPAR